MPEPTIPPPPTAEQRDIIRAFTDSTDNVIVNALAGTGKTTLIEMVARSLPREPILYLAFNKRIVTEAEKRMPPNTVCKTQNSLGHRAWGEAVGKRLTIETKKSGDFCKMAINELGRRFKEEAWDDFGETLRWIASAKRDGYVPLGNWPPTYRPAFASAAEWLANKDDRPSPLQMQLIDETLCRSIKAAYEGLVDFDDQIYMPVLFGGTWPKFPLVLIDEAQDWGPLGHIMLSRLVVSRLGAVGDPWQSIYAFKGAVCNGMAQLRERWSMREFPLSVTWRVPKRGVERANARVPSYRAADTNPEGAVHELKEWGPQDIPAEAAIICRNNAPLLSLGFKLLHAGRPIKLVGFDIGSGLVRVLRKLGPPDLSAQGITAAIDKWLDTQLAGNKPPESVYDRAECLRALTQGRETLAQAVTHAEALFKREGPLQLMSGHKSKGLEFDNVFHLDPWRIPSRFAKEGEALEQELNIRYVIETRFKLNLYLVSLETYQGD